MPADSTTVNLGRRYNVSPSARRRAQAASRDRAAELDADAMERKRKRGKASAKYGDLIAKARAAEKKPVTNTGGTTLNVGNASRVYRRSQESE